MKGDFSNDTFDPTKHYSSVRMQQGRVQLDSDWNQQMDIFDHRIQTETIDFIGGPGAPTGNPGYGITLNNNALKIGKGRYYVNGLLCENETDNLDFLQQPDYPVTSFKDAGVTSDGAYLAYLDVWQRGVTAVEDPGLLDPALNGVDTTTRAKNIAQVKLLYNKNNLSIKDLLNTLTPISTGTLTPVLTEGVDLQNQLYRVEVHESGQDGTATFKWSRDNGAIAARVQAVDANAKIITLYGASFNQQQNPFVKDQWIELSNSKLELLGQPGTLIKIVDVISQTQISVTGADISGFGDGSTIRLWNVTDSDGITIKSNINIVLEQGLSIQFTAGKYNTGDYWVIPTRAANNTVIWPQNSAGAFLAKTPQGIQHYYAPLASLTATNTATNPTWNTTVISNRTLFDPLAVIYSKYFIPVGTVLPFAGVAAPAGYFLCDGRQLSATDPQYQALYGVIANTYGGNNQTFNLPDLRSRLPLGAGQGNGLSQRNLGAKGGVESVILTVDQIPAHNHKYKDTYWSEFEGPDQFGGRHAGSPAGTDFDNFSWSFDRTTENIGGGNSHENMPPFLVLNYIIKY